MCPREPRPAWSVNPRPRPRQRSGDGRESGRVDEGVDAEEQVSGSDDHDACVAAWMKRADRFGPAERWQFFEQALDAIWQRAHRTLGDVTLTAIVGRVLHDAAQRVPLFGALTVEASGFCCEGLRERASTADPHELAEGMRFVLVEYLTVLGSLTADVMTPALHSELSNAAPAARDRATQTDGKTSSAEGEREL
jgi:hypothetical protein